MKTKGTGYYGRFSKLICKNGHYQTKKLKTAANQCLLCHRNQYHTARKRAPRHGALRLTEQEYQNLAVSQNNKCAICLKLTDSPLFIDHSHKTQHIRGLLCRTCNLGIGFFKDSTGNLRRAIKYLKSNGSMAKYITPEQQLKWIANRHERLIPTF